MEHFLSDTGPGAYERLVDDLLESSHFGERWGRHWLDVVGYADTVGFDQDSKLIVQTGGKWRYRDYVIRAFNEDKPYNQFVTEQLAGDEAVSWRDVDHFTPEIRDNLMATGFLRTARDQTHEPESNIPLSYFGVLHDTVQIVCNSLLGLTAQCARCHSHKFDPIPQQDYYRLMAAFTPAYNPHRWKPVHAYKPYIDERSLIDVSEREKKEIQQYNAGLDRQLSEWKPEIETILEAARPALREKNWSRFPQQYGKTSAQPSKQIPNNAASYKPTWRTNLKRRWRSPGTNCWKAFTRRMLSKLPTSRARSTRSISSAGPGARFKPCMMWGRPRPPSCSNGASTRCRDGKSRRGFCGSCVNRTRRR